MFFKILFLWHTYYHYYQCHARKRKDRHACGFDPTCRLSLLVLQDMDPPKLGRAAEIYEQLGRSCMEKKLLAMNAKGYWLQTGLCLLGELLPDVERRVFVPDANNVDT